MAKVTSRQTLIDYALRELGAPVIKINVAQEQIDDRIDDAIQKFQEYNSEATVNTFLKHAVTQTDIDNGFIPIPESVISMSRVLPLSGASKGDMFAEDWGLQANAISKLRFTQGGSGGLHSYEIAMNHLEMIDMMFSTGNPSKFNRYQGRLYLDIDWEKELSVGDMIVFEGAVVVDPEQTPLIYNDIMLKAFAVQLIKRQWGNNLKKYDGVTMPGGITLDGQKMYDEADAELKELNETMRDLYELPVDFIVG